MVAVANRGGYAAASVSEVIAQAGVSRPTFYEHFTDRDACFLANLSDALGQLLERTRGALEARAPEDALAAALQALVAFALEEPASARFLLGEALAGPTAALDARDRGIAEIARLIERRFARLSAEQPIPDLPLAVTIGAAQRLLAARLRRGELALSAVLDELLGWIGSYSRPAGEHRWRMRTATAGAERSRSSTARPRRAPRHLSQANRRPAEQANEVDGAANQRQRILLATAQVVAERGYMASTATDIAKLARVDGSTFYRLFADKQDAFGAAYEHGFRRATEIVGGAYFAASGWPERVWQALRVATEQAQSDPTAVHIGFVAGPTVGPGAIQRVEDSRFAFTIFLHEGYGREPARAAPPPLTPEALVTSVFEIFYRQAREGSSRPMTSLLPHMAYLCLAPSMGPERAELFIDEKLSDTCQQPDGRDAAPYVRPPAARAQLSGAGPS
jgi:AcrR family transcriptional regulator